MFDPKQFMYDVVSKNAEAIPQYFAPDAIICWHDSNEQFTFDEFMRANCEYPSTWTCTIERIETIDKGYVIAAQLDHPADGYYVKYVSFVELVDDKIKRLDEYFVWIEEVPDWRKAMNIGKPIQAHTSETKSNEKEVAHD